jgi:hypothetical protein
MSIAGRLEKPGNDRGLVSTDDAGTGFDIRQIALEDILEINPPSALTRLSGEQGKCLALGIVGDLVDVEQIANISGTG